MDTSAEIKVVTSKRAGNSEVCVAELSFGRPMRKIDMKIEPDEVPHLVMLNLISFGD